MQEAGDLSKIIERIVHRFLKPFIKDIDQFDKR
jgi:hypothetical protein